MQTLEHCLAMAEACERRFRESNDKGVRRFLRCLRKSWIKRANRLMVAEAESVVLKMLWPA